MSGTPQRPTGGLPQCPGFLRENLKAFLDGELAPLKRTLVRWHITRCAHCREEAAWLRRLGEDMRTLEKAAPRPELRRRILAGLPPPPPQRAPMKIWRPERAAFRYGPSLALGAAVGAFALGGSFVALRRVPKAEQQTAAIPSATVRETQVPAPPKREIAAAQFSTATVDPFAPFQKSAVTDDPTSRRANALYYKTARRLALQRQAEARLASGQTPVKVAAPPLLTLRPAPNDADFAGLRKRLEALAIQAGGEIKTLPLPQNTSRRVVPNVALESRNVYHPADSTAPTATSSAEADNAQIALRIPQGQWRPFLQAAKTLGTLKSAPVKSASKVKSADALFSRDTPPADADGYVVFRVQLLPAN